MIRKVSKSGPTLGGHSAAIADSATTDDLLGFDQFAIPVANRIGAATEESTPLTIGIYGEWGSGKTSFLMMVDEVLRQRDIYPVWFNAWKYDREENLWSALLQTILDQAKVNGKWYQRVAVKLRLWRDSIDISSGMWELAKKLCPVVVRSSVIIYSLVLILSYSSIELQNIFEKLANNLFSITGEVPLLYAHITKGIVALLGLIAAKPDSWLKLIDPKLGIDFSKLSRKPTYREHIAFLDEFSDEFERIIELIGRGKPLVVIIDDLDRCLPEKALQILEAIKLFLDVKRCVFLLAVDREVVEKAVSVKYRDLLAMLKDEKNQSPDKATFLGENYFDKIIHLSIPVPPLYEEQVRGFISELYKDKDVNSCSKIFARGLPRNPRKIKRILQNFLFLRDVSKNNTQAPQIKPSLLAKMVIIQNQFRDVYRELILFPNLLIELEKYYKKKTQAHADGETVIEPDIEDVNLRALVETYANQDIALQHVLMERVSDQDTFIGTKIEDYVFLLRTVSAERIEEASPKAEKRPGAKDFFISYHTADRHWAEWVAWQLEEAGYSTVIQAWDFRPGSNFVLDMNQAANQAKRTIAIISQSYLDSIMSKPEWASAFAQDPTGKKGTLLPIRIEDCELRGILSSIVYLDFVGLNENEARKQLLSALSSVRAKPSSMPSFPGPLEKPTQKRSFPKSKKVPKESDLRT